MPRITISGPAHAYRGNPRDRVVVSDEETLLSLDGMSSIDSCDDHLSDELQQLRIHYGYLRFAFDSDSRQLKITTTYHVYDDLSEDQIKQLIVDTQAQWSDGIGSGSFSRRGREVPSATLAMALQNAGHDLTPHGDVFLEAFPDVEDRSTTHSIDDRLMPSDWLLFAIVGLVIALVLWWLL